MGFDTLYARINEIKKDIPQLGRDAVIENKQSILKMLQRDQLNQGIASDGGMITGKRGTPYEDGHYKKKTEEYWSRRSPLPVKPKIQGTQYNFEWTGSTFRLMDIKMNTSDFEIFSRDTKFEILKEFYGDVFDLTPENNHFLNENVILPYIHKHLLKKLVDMY